MSRPKGIGEQIMKETTVQIDGMMSIFDDRPRLSKKTPVGTFIFLRLRPFHAYKRGTTDMGRMKMDPGHE